MNIYHHSPVGSKKLTRDEGGRMDEARVPASSNKWLSLPMSFETHHRVLGLT